MIKLTGHDWATIEDDLDANGNAILRAVLSTDQCAQIAALYDDDAHFRSRVAMERHNFGRGEYKYFGYPLPDPIQALRECFYACLAPVANRWAVRLSADARYPARLDDYLAECHGAGQRRPTPLMLRYGPGDSNCLHRDLYGERFFPLQAIIALGQPGVDFTGGELMLVEQRPRTQSIGRVICLNRGDAAIIATDYRPRRGTRGFYRVTAKHGVSPVTRGIRKTLGLIFHDAA